jgi:hypothetical protein
MLVNFINEILVPVLVSTPSGVQTQLPLQCHQATCYWLYQAANNSNPPDGSEFVDGIFNESQPLLGKIARLGRKLSETDFIRKSVSGGTVLIFCSETGDAEHSCVMRWDGSIGGYNQQGWFGTQPPASTFSAQNSSDIPWTGSKRNKVVLANRNPPVGNLIGVQGAIAVEYVRSNMQ